MKNRNISRIISCIDEKYINEATAFASDNDGETVLRNSPAAGKTGKPSRRMNRWVIAACLVWLAVICVSAFALSAEVKEYNNAVKFFEQNGLSTDGLSRSEVKAVYRDIMQNKFSYEKTSQVIMQAVSGSETVQDELTPEELAALWNEKDRSEPEPEKEISFRVDYQDDFDEEKGIRTYIKSVLECLLDGETLWKTEITKFVIEDYLYSKDGTVIWGYDYLTSSLDTSHGWIAFADGEGNLLWQRRLEHGFEFERIASVFSNGDGTWDVISRGDVKFICLSCYDADGNEISLRKTETERNAINQVARLGDGYIIDLLFYDDEFTRASHLIKMDREGVLDDRFSYKEDGYNYFVTDITEYEGQAYISAYATLRRDDNSRGFAEIIEIIFYLFSREDKGIGITSEELTPMVRNVYTAVLLKLDPEGGEAEPVCTAEGSLGGKLKINAAGQLEWEVESIATTYYSPTTNSYQLGGSSNVFCYTFDAEGTLLRKADTGKTAPFRR